MIRIAAAMRGLCCGVALQGFILPASPQTDPRWINLPPLQNEAAAICGLPIFSLVVYENKCLPHPNRNPPVHPST